MEAEQLEPAVADAIGMTAIAERQFLQQFAREEFTGQGEIVDLGSWLGSSVMPLAAGLSKNARVKSAHPSIHAYDTFRWSPWMDPVVRGTPLEGRYADEESFEDEFLTHIAPWQKYVQVYSGDLCTIGWPSQKPIEFLFVDAMKDWKLANAIIRNFMPFLIPERSFLVHKDFAFHGCPWIHLLMYRHRAFFAPVGHIAHTHSMVFRCVKPIGEQEMQTTYGLETFDDDEIAAAYRYCSELVGPEMRQEVFAARDVLYAHSGRSRPSITALRLMFPRATKYFDRTEAYLYKRFSK
jgi:hypothetical protein